MIDNGKPRLSPTRTSIPLSQRMGIKDIAWIVLCAFTIVYGLMFIFDTSLIIVVQQQGPTTEPMSTKLGFRLVTAFSSNHFNEALTCCKSVQKLPEFSRFGENFMVAYVLDHIPPRALSEYQKICPFVDIRDFNFSAYPEFVKNMKTYRWKPLIVAEMIRETSTVFWLDSSVVFRPERLPNASIHALISEMPVKYSQCGVRTFDDTHHSIFSATHPSMLDYFNISADEAGKRKMLGATTFVAIDTPGFAGILKAWVGCALDEKCMAPQGARLNCRSADLGLNRYANCHRYDQSALAILLAKCSQSDAAFIQGTPFVSVERG